MASKKNLNFWKEAELFFGWVTAGNIHFLGIEIYFVIADFRSHRDANKTKNHNFM